MIFIGFFIFGLFLGSLLNNIALRLEAEEDFIFSRSKCPNCLKQLRWFELIPIVSFLVQKGRCRDCDQKISWRYPLVEILTGVWVSLLAFSIIDISGRNFFNGGFLIWFSSIYYLIFLSIIFVLALFDFKTTYIDERFIWFGVIVWLIFQFAPFLLAGHLPGFIKQTFENLNFTGRFNYLFPPTLRLTDQLFRAYVFSIIFVFVFLATLGRGMGLGDAKVIFLMGLFLNWGDLAMALFLSFLFGSIYGLVRLMAKKKFFQEVPFVPFLFLGIIITMFGGGWLSKFYFNWLSLG